MRGSWASKLFGVKAKALPPSCSAARFLDYLYEYVVKSVAKSLRICRVTYR